MIVIDNISIIVIAVLLVLAVATPWISIFVRRPHPKQYETDGEDPEDDTPLPGITVVLTPHENGQELKENLPLFLNQQYGGDFQVVLVIWKSDTEAADILKGFSSNPHLYVTYIPDSSRYMSRKKLSITLGVKAAKYDWVVMTEATNKPAGDNWLATLARNCREGVSLVLGYTYYNSETSSYRQYLKFVDDLYLMRETEHGRTFRCNSTCLMFAKQAFVDWEGFRGNLKYLRGEYDFIANKYFTYGETLLETDPDAWMEEEEPTDKEWKNKQLFYQEDRKHLRGRARHRLPIAFDQTFLHLDYLVILAAIAYSVITQKWVIAAAAAIAMIVTTCIRNILAGKALDEWGVDVPHWKSVWYDLSFVWHWLSYKLKYAKADKTDFISHKI